MKRVLIIPLICLSLIISGCNSQNTFSTDEVSDALGNAEEALREDSFVTASSYRSNEYAKFRIMAGNNTTNQKAKQLVEKFINIFENALTDLDGFYMSHSIMFDIKSNEDGEILYMGKKDENDNEIWWNHLGGIVDNDLSSEKEELTKQIIALKEENLKISMGIELLEKEKREFFTADQYGREFYKAMVHADVEKLKQLTTSDFTVFDDHFEVVVSEEIVKIPFNHLQSEQHLSDVIILKTNGYGFDHDSQHMKIHYMIIHHENSSAYYLTIGLNKVDTLEWVINEIEFDI